MRYSHTGGCGGGEGGGGGGGGGSGGDGGGDGQATTTPPPDIQALPLQYLHEPESSGHGVWPQGLDKPPDEMLMSVPTSHP